MLNLVIYFPKGKKKKKDSASVLYGRVNVKHFAFTVDFINYSKCRSKPNSLANCQN